MVDDTPANVKLLADLLAIKGYAVATARSGEEALAQVAAERPDLILLDVMMPGMSGYDVCRQLRGDPETALLPIVLVTSLDPQQERIKGIASGADDFLAKPINQPELFARVQSLLRIKRLHEETQAAGGAARRVERHARAARRRAGGGERAAVAAEAILFAAARRADRQRRLRRPAAQPAARDRRGVLDLRGFTAFAETFEPEEVMRTLGTYHAAMGRLVMAHEATLERFTGDGMMIFLGDPVPVENARREARAAGARDARGGARAVGRLEEARRRPRARHRHRPGLRHRRRDRLRGPDRLRGDRHRHQPGRAGCASRRRRATSSCRSGSMPK